MWRAIGPGVVVLLAASGASAAPPADSPGRYVAGLMRVVKTTRSPDAFLVAVKLLAAEKADTKRFTPTIIRHAERLGLFADTLRRGDEAAGKAAEALARHLEVLAEQEIGVEAPRPWVTERLPEKREAEPFIPTRILPPIKPGAPLPICDDPPDEARILRAMPRRATDPMLHYEERRENVQIVTELIIDRIDPPRSFPLIGPARLHRCHWKCTVYYDEVIEVTGPFPFRLKTPRLQDIYMDIDHLHLEMTGPLDRPPLTPATGRATGCETGPASRRSSPR